MVEDKWLKRAPKSALRCEAAAELRKRYGKIPEERL